MGHKPELFAYTKRATYEAAKTGTTVNRAHFGDVAKQSLGGQAKHWGSVYKN